MANAKKIVLVEGESDKSFFEAVCKILVLDTNIQVAPPRDIGGVHNSKQGIFKQLSILLSQFEDGTLTHLAVIMDADYASTHGLGCQATIAQMTEKLNRAGFTLKRTTNTQAGLFFEHADGFNDIGFWVMPNNQDDGMLEDWIKACVSTDEQALFQHAVTTITTLPIPIKFKEIHRSKAEVATWLAWQKKPGHGPYSALEDSCIDSNSAQFTQLASWLRQVFE